MCEREIEKEKEFGLISLRLPDGRSLLLRTPDSGANDERSQGSPTLGPEEGEPGVDFTDLGRSRDLGTFWQLSTSKLPWCWTGAQIMRILTPCNTLLSPRDVRLISNVIQGPRSYPPPPLNLSSRCRSPRALVSRGVKTKATKKLKELHQGVVAAEPLPELESEDAPQYPTVIQGAKNNMIKFSNCVLITRVGSFYEVRSTYSPSANR